MKNEQNSKLATVGLAIALLATLAYNRAGWFWWALYAVFFYSAIKSTGKPQAEDEHGEYLHERLRKEIPVSLTCPSNSSDTFYRWASDGTAIGVAGTSYRQVQIKKILKEKNINATGIDVTATLVPETSNKHDKYAVRIEIHGVHIGYIPADLTQNFRGMLARRGLAGNTTSCDARLYGGYIKDNGESMPYGANFYVKRLGG